MLDKTIPYKNIIMRWDGAGSPVTEEVWGNSAFPGGSILKYQRGDAVEWVRIQMEAGEFLDEGKEEAMAYFLDRYEAQEEELKERCLFFADADGRKVGTCMAWREKDERRTPSVHWLAVSEEMQGRGIGRMLLRETLRLFAKKGEIPVYLHTQPWSYRAVSLYLSTGFRFCMNETFGGYENQNREAIGILQAYMELPEGKTLTQIHDMANYLGSRILA